MYKLLTKNGQMFAFGLGAIVTVLTLVLILSGLEDFSMLDKATKPTSNIFNFGIVAGIALVVICAAAMLIFGIIQIVSNPKGSMKGIIGLVAIVVIFFIAKTVASGEAGPALQGAIDKLEISDTVSSNISGGIITTLIIGMVAVAALVISEVRNFFK